MKTSRFHLFAPGSSTNLTISLGRRAAIVSTVAALFALHSPTQAAVTWVGNTSADWNTPSNWSSAPVLAGDSFTFGAAGTAGTTLNNNIVNQVIATGAFTFSAVAPAYTLNGNAVTTTGSTTTLTNSSSALQTINLPLNLAASLTIAGGADITLGGAIGQAGTFGSRTITNNLTAGNLILGGAISMSDGTARAWTFTGSSAGSTRVTGGLQNAGAGVSPLTISPTNTAASVVLSGSNTYTGLTTVSSGKLSLDFSAAAVSTNLISSTPALTLGGGTLSITGKSGATNTQSVGGTTTLNTNKSNAIRVVQNGAASVSLTLATLTRNGGATLDFTLPTVGGITTTSTSSAFGTNQILTSAAFVAYATVDGTTWATNTAGTIGALASYQTDFADSALDSDITANDAPAAAFSVNTLRFNTAGKALTLNSLGTSTVTSGGILVTAAGAGSSIGSGGGAAGLTAPAAKDIVLINHATGAGFTISAPILDNSVTQLTIAGNGITTLSGVNTYAGGTNLTGGGTVILGTKNAFGSGAGLVTWMGAGTASVGTGASTTLQAGTDLSGANKIINPVSLPGFGVVSGVNNLELGGTFTGNSGGSRTLTSSITGGTLTLSGSVLLSNNDAARTLTIAGTGNTTISGVIANFAALAGSLAVTNTGVTTLSGNNIYTGLTTMNSATGTLTLGGNNVAATGGVTLTLGKLNVNHASALGTGTLAINGGTLDNTTNALVTNSANNAVTWANTFVFGTASGTPANNLNLGTGTVVASANRSMSFAGTGTTLTMGPLNSTSTATGRTFTFDGAGNTMVLGGFTISAATSATTAILAGSANLTIAGPVVNGAAFANGLTINRTGLTILSGTNTYTGPTDIEAGILQVNGPQALPSASILNSGAGATGTSALNLATASNTYAMSKLSIDGTMKFTGPVSGTSTLTFTNGAEITGASSGRMIDVGTGTTVVVNGTNFDFIGAAGPNDRVTDFTVNGAMTINAVVQDNASGASAGFVGGFNKLGAGVLTLTGANTYGGATTVSAGTLQVNGPQALPITSVLYSGASNADTSALNLATASNGYTMSKLSIGGIMRFTGPVSGTSTLTFNNGAEITGIESGRTIDVGTGTTVVVNGANFDFIGAAGPDNRVTEVTVNGAMTINAVVQDNASGTSTGFVGGFHKLGAGVLTLTGANTYGGATTVGAGTLLVNNANTGAGAVSVAIGATLGGSGSLAAAVTAAGTIAPGNAGAGTLTTGAATLTGTLAVEINGATGDKLVSTGALNLTGATLTVAPIGAGFTLGSYVIAQYASRTGAFAVPSGYTVTYSATEATLAPAVVTSPYTVWANSFGLENPWTTVANPALNGEPTADPDKDGMTNQQEYAFGLIPNSGSSVNPVKVQLNKTTGLFTYTRRKQSLTTLTYGYEYSTTLSGAWTPFTPDSTVSNSGDPVEEIIVDVPNGLLTNTKLFVRVTAQ